MIAPAEAKGLLTVFGTGLNYKGLWASALDAKPLTKAELDAVPHDWKEIVPIPPMAKAMVEIDDAVDALKEIEKANWQTPKDHADLDPAHEALKLEELLTEVGRSDAAKDHGPDFAPKMTASIEAAKSLRTMLETNGFDHAKASSAYKAVTASCLDCHKQFRDE